MKKYYRWIAGDRGGKCESGFMFACETKALHVSPWLSEKLKKCFIPVQCVLTSRRLLVTRPFLSSLSVRLSRITAEGLRDAGRDRRP